LDSKGVFTEGFNALQIKLDEKFYTSVQTFSEDVSAVFSSVIGFATLTNVGDAEQQLSGVAHSTLTSEQKQNKALAKRIIKAIQPYFDEALRKESDLAGKPHEKELPDLEALLDQRLRRQADAAADKPMQTSVKAKHEECDTKERTGETAVKGNGTMHLAPTPEDNSGDARDDEDDDAANEAAIAAQFGSEGLHVTGRNPDTMDVDEEGGEHISSGGTAPLTPPRSEKDLLAPLAHGGIPWYMEPFDPVGTTVHDEKWTGRDVLRDMSEELSELDDDELNGLADPEELQPADGSGPETGVSAAHQTAVRKAKRRRGYR
jgi:NuA3 HAT complex component NTO1